MSTLIGVGTKKRKNTEEVVTLNAQVKRLTETVENLTQKNYELEAEKVKLTKQVEDLTVEKTALETENTNISKQAEDLTKIVEDFKKNKTKE